MVPNRSLKQARELRGWSQAKVAREIGTDATTVSRWERGLFLPTPYFRERLCAVFEKNTEELGLLETTELSRGCERSDDPFHLPSTLSLVSQHEEPLRDEGDQEHVPVLVPPCWSESTDTFAYILRSAVHDHQAHMLWKDAYVRALLGQNAEARRLGEASLRAFERLGHVNAQAVREWLNHDFFDAGPSRTTVVPVVPSSPSVEQQRFKAFVRDRGTRIALLLIGSFWFLFSLDFPLVK